VRLIRSVVFNADSVELQYMDESDVRLEGSVFLTHHMTVSRNADHDDEIATVEDATMDLLTDVLADFAKSLPYDPRVDVEEDDDDDD
jgi:hypothetical protein